MNDNCSLENQYNWTTWYIFVLFCVLKFLEKKDEQAEKPTEIKWSQIIIVT
jgi:hypothetical protein